MQNKALEAKFKQTDTRTRSLSRSLSNKRSDAGSVYSDISEKAAQNLQNKTAKLQLERGNLDKENKTLKKQYNDLDAQEKALERQIMVL